MSKQLETVIQRAISDAAFRRQLQSNPEAALRGFKLTQDEVAALRSGDATKLMSLGIDQRMSKVFAVPGENLNRASIGDLLEGSSSPASGPAAVLRDPDNPANARGYIGDQGGSAPRSDAIEDQSHAFAASRDQGGSTSSASILRDPDNPANARGYIGHEATSESASTSRSVIGDPDNPVNARGYIGDQASSAPTSDAIEDQSHAFAASRDQGASTSHASILGDPDNPANARGYIGDQTASAPTSDAIEDQSHAFAASRDQGASTSHASILGDPDNPANARGYIGDQSSGSFAAAPLEGTPEQTAVDMRDQTSGSSHASVLRDPDNPANARGYIGGEGGSTSQASAFGDPENLANRSGFVSDQSPNSAATNDAFLSQGEAGQYSTDPNASSDMAEDTSHAFNPAESAATPEVDPSASTHHDGDIPI
jgi:hypothetical protein